MCDEFITAKHIEKLSHHIPEIRERALLNIHSKLQRGIFYDNDLARCKELFWQLCNWFRDTAPVIRHDEIATTILTRIITSPTGIYLIDLHGSHDLIKEFTEIKNIVAQQFQCHIDEIIHYLEEVAAERHPHVPPLNLDDLRSQSSEDSPCLPKEFETTATTIAGFVDSLVSLDVADNNNVEKSSKTRRIQKVGEEETVDNPFQHYTFLWQWLIGADRHVLESVESTLRNPNEPTELLNSFEFISDVLLNDFPAEVLLQRPAIVKQLHDLLWSSPSSRITTAILKCLSKLTKELISRICYYDRPGTHNLKLNNFHLDDTPDTTHRDNEDSSSTDIETIADTVNLLKYQMNLPQFCLNTINGVFDYLYVNPEAGDSFRRKTCQVGINIALVLLRDAIQLLKMSVKGSIFDAAPHKSSNVGVTLKKIEETFRKYGEVLSYFRIKVLSEDFNDDIRQIQLHLLANFVYFYQDYLPTGRPELLPANLKHALSETLLDAAFGRIYPSLHRSLYVLTKSFQSDNIYEDVLTVCASMTSTMRFLREWKSLPFTKNISLMDESLVSLEIHRNVHQISLFIDLCGNKLTTHTFDEDILLQIERILLKLLSHQDVDIRHSAYKNCHAKVVRTIGAKTNVSKSSAPGAQILFLLRGRILALIAMQGLRDTSDEIQGLCEDMLIHVLKAKLLVSAEIWQETVVALMPTMPLLLTHAADKKSLIGRHVLALLDPDRSRLMNFSSVEVLRLNIGLLFVPNAEVRMEAASRLCWLLSSATLPAPSAGNSGACGSRERRKEVRLLPHLNNLHDKVLAEVCQLDRRQDCKTYRSGHTHFYQPSSLHQVLDLLVNDIVEPVIRRSAITQVSVMMEDPMLHAMFLERNGLEILQNAMKSALTDEEYQDYPDAVIPCLCVLRSLCLYSASVRQEISNAEELLHYILRAIFMFCAEPRVKQDGGVLLFLVVFNEFVRGTPVKNDLRIADVMQNAINCPLEANSYATVADYCLPTLKHLKENRWAMSSLQIHWNIEYFQGLEKLLEPHLAYKTKNTLDQFSSELRLKPTDLCAVKSTSMHFTLTKALDLVFQSHSHEMVLENIYLLTRCVYLYKITKDENSIDLDTLEWEKAFSRYLNAPPAGQEDNLLLAAILDLFSMVLPLLNVQGSNSTWIISMITSRTHYFSVLLAVELTQEQEHETEKLLASLLTFISTCVTREQSLFESTSHLTMDKYAHIVKILMNNVQCNNSKHFYNLAYLDRLLTTLTHLTAHFGWSDAKYGDTIKKVMVKASNCGFELLNAFHCGKGPTAADSLMGLNITRNVVFILNHLVAEMQHFGIKDWEECITDVQNTEVESAFRTIFILKNSREVVLRASAVHLLSGFAMSERCAILMIQDIAQRSDFLCIWKSALSILCDNDESAIVRESAALLLTNLSSHVKNDNGEVAFVTGLLVKIKRGETFPDAHKNVLMALLDSCNFFNAIETILKRLRTDVQCSFGELRGHANSNLDDFMFLYNKVLEVSNVSDSLNPMQETKSVEKFEDTFGITTPGVVKGLATFVFNISRVLPHLISQSLQTFGLIKLFFKCITVPSLEIETTRDLMVYSDVLQMNTAICALLAKTAEVNDNCLLTIGNCRDCISTTIALLNPALYVVSLPELHYLRNKLWSSIFNLLNVLLQGGNQPISDQTGAMKARFDTNALVMQLESRKEPFLLSLCESINTDVSNDLQSSALHSLCSLLNCNEERKEDNDQESLNNSTESTPRSSRSSVQLILDCTRTPRMESSRTIAHYASKFDILKEICFGTSKTSKSNKSSLSLSSISDDENGNEEVNRMAGAELCKILLELYENLNLQQPTSSTTLTKTQKPQKTKRKTIVLNTLTCLLLVSNEAKHYALEHGLVAKLVSQVQTIYVQLSLENVESLRRMADKKRLTPVLQEMEAFLGLMLNFLYGNEAVKAEAAQLGLTDVIHKLWHWLAVQRTLHIAALKLLCTLTTSCASAAASLALTSATPGSGPRKTPNNLSLLHVICSLVTKEMELISKTHDLEVLQLSFHILHNAVEVTECRFIILKNNFLAAVSKLHPALTKRQKPWEQVELLWLEFLNTFSSFAEGQSVIGRMQDVFEIVLCMCGCPNVANRFQALQCLRNIAFYPGNRARLLASDDFLNILSSRLSSSNTSEISIVVPAMWALAANCQKAKMIFKAARLDAKIKDYLRVLYLNNYANVTDDDVETLRYVHSLLTQNS